MNEAPAPSGESSPSAVPPRQGGTSPPTVEKKAKKPFGKNRIVTLANGAKIPFSDLEKLSLEDLSRVHWRNEWFKTARPNQNPPDGDWTIWGVVSGRGWGKTLTAAQWMAWQCAWKPNTIGHVIAPTLNDTKHVCFEGPTGLLKVLPEEIVKDYNKSSMLITLDNGSTIRGFSAEEPNRLRGPQCAVAWCFPAGTMVMLPDGRERPIEVMRVGDMVATRHGPRRVTAAGLSPNLSPLVRITFGETAPGPLSLTATEDHLIWANGGWCEIGKIKPGYFLWELKFLPKDSALGHMVPVKTVERLERREPVYNLTVEGEHEFIANGIVVHNCDELAAWQDADETWDMMMMGLRLGPHPQVMFTTTPRPVEIMRRLLQDKGVQITRGSTYENRANLPESFFKQIQQYEGTQLGRQELLGELIDPEESGIVKRGWFKLWPAKRNLPRFQWVVLSLDTAFTEATIDRKTGNADYTACSVWGVFDHEGRNNIMLLDAWQERLGMPDLIAKVKKELKKSYGDPDAPLIKPLFGPQQTLMAGRAPDIVLIEDKGSGISLRQMLDREGIRAYAYNPGRASKIQRLHMVSHIFANKMVWLVESDKNPGRPRNWAEPLLAQLCSFAGEGSLKHDDFVDCTTQAIRLLADKRFLEVVPKDRLPQILPPLKPRTNPYAA